MNTLEQAPEPAHDGYGDEAHERHYRQAVCWVQDEVEQRTCLADEESRRYAEGFVTGMMYGMRKVSAMGWFPTDPTAENYWRANLRLALEWERTGGRG